MKNAKYFNGDNVSLSLSNLYFRNRFMRMPRNISIVQGKLGNSDDPIGHVVPYMQLRNSWDMIDEE